MGFLYLFLLLLPFLLFRPKDVFQPEAAVNGYYLLFIALGPVALAIASPQQFLSGEYFFSATLVLVGYLSLNLGFFLATLFRRRNLQPFTRVVPTQGRSLRYKIASTTLLLVSSAALLLFFARAGIPLLAENKEAARVEALSISGNGYLLYLATLGMPAVLLVACAKYDNASRRGVRTRPDIFLAFLAIAVGVALMGTGSRRYFFWSLLYVFIARHYLAKRFSITFMLISVAVGFTFVNVFEMYRNSASDTTADLFTATYYRLIVYFYNLEATFTAFRQSEPMYGSTFVMDILTALPGKQIDYQSWIKSVTGLEFEGFGVPPTIVGDMYINFGYPGIVMGCVLFGWLLKTFYFRKITSVKRSALSVFIYALALEISIRTLTSGFSAQAMGYLWIMMIYLFVKSSGKIFSGPSLAAPARAVRIA